MERSANLAAAQECPLLAAWEQVRSQRGDLAAVRDPTGAVERTFNDIEERARFFANGTALAEFAAGAVIAIQIGNHADWPSLLLACRRRELVVLPLETTIGEEQRAGALETCAAAGLITLEYADAVAITRIGAGAAVDWGQATPALLKLTSGTTARPRAVRFRSSQLLADAENICTTMGITERDLNFGVVPMSHSYGFSNLLTPLLAHGVPMVLSRERLPRAVLDDLARTNATVFPGMPVFFQAFAQMEAVPRLPALRLCISAGAPLSGSTARAFAAKFGQPVHSFYGASECGGIAYDRTCSARPDGFVGEAMSGVEIELLDGEDASRLRVRSAAVGDGYFPEPEPAKLHAGVFYPDDLIERTAEGLRLAGRTGDVINVAGKKLHPAEVEVQLLACAGVRQAVVFGRESRLRNQEVAACVVTDGTVTEAALLAFCRERLSGWQVPKRLLMVDEIPANERGKISRRELAARFRD